MTQEPIIRETHMLGLASFILAIVGLFTSFLFPFAIQIIGIILGHVASSEIRMNPQKYTGDGLVFAGLVINYIMIVLSLVGVIVLGGIFAVFLGTA